MYPTPVTSLLSYEKCFSRDQAQCSATVAMALSERGGSVTPGTENDRTATEAEKESKLTGVLATRLLYKLGHSKKKKKETVIHTVFHFKKVGFCYVVTFYRLYSDTIAKC